MKYFYLLILVSFGVYASIHPLINMPRTPARNVQLVVDRLEDLFKDKDFIAKANQISPTLREHFDQGFDVEITTDLLDDNIAEYSAGVITIDTRFILQANPFHASTLCHEIAHHYGYDHMDDEDYYSSIPYLFGELCRIEYTKKHWYTWGGTILSTKQAKKYLEEGTL